MLIALEGGDGVGKATQTRLLAERMRGVVVSFPAYATPVGEVILSHLKTQWQAVTVGNDSELVHQEDKELNARVLQSLMTVNRLEMLPAIAEFQRMETPVILDRYWASAMVYGVADGLDPTWLRLIHASLPEPDAWLLLDGPPRREVPRDRYESDGKATQRRQLYKELWAEHRPDRRWQVVNGDGTIEQVHDRICDALGTVGVLI